MGLSNENAISGLERPLPAEIDIPSLLTIGKCVTFGFRNLNDTWPTFRRNSVWQSLNDITSGL
jgi:hypothetical protein